MKLCPNCRRRLPILVVYMLALAGLLGFAAGTISYWSLAVMAGVFALAGIGGIVYACFGSCYLCKAAGHRHQHAHHDHEHGHGHDHGHEHRPQGRPGTDNPQMREAA